MAKLVNLNNKDGQTIYPKTLTDAVYDNTGKTVTEVLTDVAYVNDKETTTPVSQKINATTLDGKASSYYANASDLTKANNEIANLKKIDSSLTDRTTKSETNIKVLSNRMSTFTALEDGSTSGDAELADIRVKADGTTAASAGDAVREQVNSLDEKIEGITNNIYPPITNYCFGLMPNDFTDAMNVSVDSDGVYNVECSLTEQVLYAGVGVYLNKTASELNGKKVLLVFHETTMLPYRVYLSNGNVWGGTNIVRNTVIPTNNVIEITVDNSLDYGSSTLRVLFNFGLNIPAGDISASFSVYISDIAKGNMVRYAEYALGAPIPELVQRAQYSDCSGYDNSVLKKFEQIVSQNDGCVIFDGLSTFDITLENMNPDTGFAYTMVSINIKEHLENCKGILLEKDDSVQYVFLSKNYNLWTTDVRISRLENGYNDITNIDLSQYSNVYLLIGVAHKTYNAATKRGKASVFCIPKSNEVIASRLLNSKDFLKKGDSVLYENSIVCWGDSLTAQGGWTTTLSQLSGMTVHNGGTGGENARTIAARQGADVMLINNITIPSDTTPITLATYTEGGFDTEFGYKVKPLLQGGVHVNPVSIGGVLGTLKWTGSNYSDTTGTWTFTRSSVGEEVVINRPTAIITAYDREKNNPHLMIIFMGTNGGFDNIDELVNMHKLMIDHSKSNHTVILGATWFDRIGDYEEYESKMRNAFGRYFISLRDYLNKYGLEDAGLTPTAEDITAINNGQVPPQLLSDGVHYTTACKEVIGNMLYKKCCDLKIF